MTIDEAMKGFDKEFVNPGAGKFWSGAKPHEVKSYFRKAIKKEAEISRREGLKMGEARRSLRDDRLTIT